jgi:vitamin B12 transporter
MTVIPDAARSAGLSLPSMFRELPDMSRLSLRFRTAAILAALFTGGAPTASAQQQPPRDSVARDSARADRLAPVVTTAKRYSARASEVPQKIDVITRADIERIAAVDVVDALKKVAAVDVIQYPTLLGGVGIRGFRPATGGIQQRTLVLLDGRPSGAYNLALVDLGSVERIEVIKGPASALYGSSAVGGVVNIVTRSSRGRPRGTVSAAYGSFQTSELAVRAGGTVAPRVDADVALRRFAQDENYRMGSGNLFRGAVGADSAFKLYPARSGRLGVDVGGGFRADARGEAFASDDALSPGDIYARESQFPGNGRKNVARRGGEFALSGTRGRHAPLLRAYGTRETGNNYNQPGADAFVSFGSRNTTTGAQLQDVVRLGAQTLTVGADLGRVRAESRRYARTNGVVGEIGTFSPNSEVSSVAAFAEARLEALAGRVVATAGGRVDRMTLDLETTPFRPDVQAGRETFSIFNPSGGVQVGLGGGVRAHASAGRAFLAPDAFGRAGYSQTVASNIATITVGNPALAPEHSVTVDAGLGVSRPGRGLDADVTYFRTRVTDRITRARASFAAARRPTLATGTPVSRVETSVNAGTAHIDGFEARLGYDVLAALGHSRSLRLFTNTTRILRAVERTPAASVDAARFAGTRDFDPTQVFGALVFSDTASDIPIRNVADLTLTYGIEYDDFSRFSGRVSGRYVGNRVDSDFSDATDISDVEYPPFMVLDLVAGVRVARRYRVDAVVSNLTDENFYEKRGYNLPGRSIQLRVRADF